MSDVERMELAQEPPSQSMVALFQETIAVVRRPPRRIQDAILSMGGWVRSALVALSVSLPFDAAELRGGVDSCGELLTMAER